MKKGFAIWNSFLSATFCALLALLAVVPRANCCCASNFEAGSQIVFAEQENAHDCCRTDNESTDSKSVLAENSVQLDGSCVCLSPSSILSETQGSKLFAESDAIFVGDDRVSAEKLAVWTAQEANLEHRDFKLLALQNDSLKPSKIYLLKRALLN